LDEFIDRYNRRSRAPLNSSFVNLMVMRVRLTVGVYSLSFKVRLKVLALYPNLTSVANLETCEISAVDEATDCPLRDLE
jgi:hypothetical protein